MKKATYRELEIEHTKLVLALMGTIASLEALGSGKIKALTDADKILDQVEDRIGK